MNGLRGLRGRINRLFGGAVLLEGHRASPSLWALPPAPYESVRRTNISRAFVLRSAGVGTAGWLLVDLALAETSARHPEAEHGIMLERHSAHGEEELGELGELEELEENPEPEQAKDLNGLAEDYRLIRSLLCDYAFPKGVLAANLAIHGMFWQVAALYLGGGLAGGLATVTSTHFQKVHHRKASVGGSAGVSAIYVAFLCARDREEPFLFLPFDFLDTFIILIIVYEAIGAITSFRSGRSLWKSNVNHTAHLGGMATGALGYQCLAPGDPKHSSMHDSRKEGYERRAEEEKAD